MTTAEARDLIGRSVIYTAPHGARDEGVITSVNDRFVFVRYGNHGSQATPPERLELAVPDAW